MGRRSTTHDEKIRFLYVEAGYAIQRIADELMLNRKTVTAALKAMGLPIQNVWGWNTLKISEQDILARHSEGMPAKTIAELAGCSKTHIHRTIRSLSGVPRRTKIVRNKSSKFTDWEFIRRLSGKYGEYRCPTCLTHRVMTSEAVKRASLCKFCHQNLFGVGGLSGDHWNSIRYHAKARDLRLDVTMDMAWLIFLEQRAACACCGTPLYMLPNYPTCRVSDDRRHNASFDRIDSNGHYTDDNVQWVCQRCQTMKWDHDEQDFFGHAIQIAAYRLKGA